MGKEISSYEVRTPVIKLVGDGSGKRGFKLRNTGGMIVEFTMFIENTESTVKRAGNQEGVRTSRLNRSTVLGKTAWSLGVKAGV